MVFAVVGGIGLGQSFAVETAVIGVAIASLGFPSNTAHLVQRLCSSNIAAMKSMSAWTPSKQNLNGPARACPARAALPGS